MTAAAGKLAAQLGLSASRVSRPWRQGSACVIVRVRLTPKSSKDAVDGIEETAEGTAFKARVRAVPTEGEANAALLKLLAQWLEVGQGSLRLAKGGKSRVKSVEITGNPDDIEARLAEKLAGFV